MTDIFDLILQEFKHREAYKSEVFAPFFIASVGSHHFNIMNTSRHIYTRSGRIVNTRVHIAFVAPPGFSKTYYLEQMLEYPTSVLGLSPIKTIFQQRMTEASAFGTMTRDQNGRVQAVEGIFQEEALSIIGIEEFANLRDSMEKQSYNIGFTDMLLSALDSGRVRKNIAAGKISYETQSTLWIATQPMRMDMASGMSRRFIYVNFLPSSMDKMNISDAQWKGENIKVDMNSVQNIRNELGFLMNNISVKGGINKVVFPDSVKTFFDKEGIPHFERSLYQNVMLGYTLMRYGAEKELVINVDNTLKKMVENEKKWRSEIKLGPVDIMLMNVIRDSTYMTSDKIVMQMSEYGVDIEETLRILKKLGHSKRIKKETGGNETCYVIN